MQFLSRVTIFGIRDSHRPFEHANATSVARHENVTRVRIRRRERVKRTRTSVPLPCRRTGPSCNSCRCWHRISHSVSCTRRPWTSRADKETSNHVMHPTFVTLARATGGMFAAYERYDKRRFK